MGDEGMWGLCFNASHSAPHTNSNEPSGSLQSRWSRAATSPRPLVPIFEPGMTSPLQGLPGFAQCKSLPTWQILTPA